MHSEKVILSYFVASGFFSGSSLNIETKLLKQDKTFSDLSEIDKRNENNIKSAKKHNRDKFFLYGIFTSCNKKRFRNLTDNLENNYTFGDNKYPITQQQIYKYLINYKHPT